MRNLLAKTLRVSLVWRRIRAAPQPTTLEAFNTRAAGACSMNAFARAMDPAQTVPADPTKVGVLRNIASGRRISFVDIGLVCRSKWNARRRAELRPLTYIDRN